MNRTKRLEIASDADSRVVLLRIDRGLLILLVTVLTFVAAVHTFGIAAGIKSDDREAVELARIRQRIEDTTEIVANANANADIVKDTSEALLRFERCAFLIEPDVEKTEAVVDACITRADFPNDGE